MAQVKFIIQLGSWCAGLPLSLLVIAAMVRGPYRQFPVLFLYVVLGFAFTVAGMPSVCRTFIFTPPS